MITRSTIDIKDLSIGYVHGHKLETICSGINLHATPGEIIALIGPNGAGKSTLIKTIVRFLEILSGDIKINEKPLSKISRDEFARMVSFVSTEPVRLAHITVFDLVALGRFPYTNWLGTLTDDDYNAITSAIRSVGIEALVNKQIQEISDGERQRTMIARALAQDTEIIVLDEPTAFLDLPNKYEVIHLLSYLAHFHNKTIIFSTHDLNIAMSEADKIWLMHHNKISEGAPEDLILNHAFDDLFENRLNFDMQTGDFVSSNKIGETLFLYPFKGLEYHWTLKALKRIGFNITSDANESKIKLKIERVEGKCVWNIESEKTSETFKDIYSLSGFLRSLSFRESGLV